MTDIRAYDMTKQEIEVCLDRALDKLYETDTHLLQVDSSERSISHRLAVHLMSELQGYDIDCEYNRDGFDVKRLELSSRPATDQDTEAVTVFPDVIIHQRGRNDRNLLVIEMKKNSSTVSSEYDIKKLRAFRKDLNYTYAVHVTVGKEDSKIIRKVIWVDC